jgi:hypothetical protein
MKHNSLADFTNKVTSKDLPNITIIRITCVTLFAKVTLFPFVSLLKVVCPLLAKSQKVSDTAAKSKKSAKIQMFCMRLSDTFLQLAKGTLISLWAVAKGDLLP